MNLNHPVTFSRWWNNTGWDWFDSGCTQNVFILLLYCVFSPSCSPPLFHPSSCRSLISPATLLSSHLLPLSPSLCLSLTDTCPPPPPLSIALPSGWLQSASPEVSWPSILDLSSIQSVRCPRRLHLCSRCLSFHFINPPHTCRGKHLCVWCLYCMWGSEVILFFFLQTFKNWNSDTSHCIKTWS